MNVALQMLVDVAVQTQSKTQELEGSTAEREQRNDNSVVKTAAKDLRRGKRQ